MIMMNYYNVVLYHDIYIIFTIVFVPILSMVNFKYNFFGSSTLSLNT
jgi:hypothetical protein